MLFYLLAFLGAVSAQQSDIPIGSSGRATSVIFLQNIDLRATRIPNSAILETTIPILTRREDAFLFVSRRRSPLIKVVIAFGAALPDELKYFLPKRGILEASLLLGKSRQSLQQAHKTFFSLFLVRNIPVSEVGV